MLLIPKHESADDKQASTPLCSLNPQPSARYVLTGPPLVLVAPVVVNAAHLHLRECMCVINAH